MIVGTLEIYYDAATVVPAGTPADQILPTALDYRNPAMFHIEAALDAQGPGEWVGAEVGRGKVNFGFDVQDFDPAEAAVRSAVKGTPYACIREFERREFDEEDGV